MNSKPKKILGLKKESLALDVDLLQREVLHLNSKIEILKNTQGVSGGGKFFRNNFLKRKKIIF